MSFYSLTRNVPLLRTLRSKKTLQRAGLRLRNEVKKRLESDAPLKIVIGSGRVEPVVGESGTPFEGWLMTDAGSLNALDAAQWRSLFPPASLDRILAEHMVEHLTQSQFRSFLNLVRPLLKAGGRMRLAVPDGFHPDPAYIDQVRPGGSGSGSDDHKVLYNYLVLSAIVSEQNWDYRLLEYFDESGKFHSHEWDVNDGFVARSERYDPRNRERVLAYTSIVIDLIA